MEKTEFNQNIYQGIACSILLFILTFILSKTPSSNFLWVIVHLFILILILGSLVTAFVGLTSLQYKNTRNLYLFLMSFGIPIIVTLYFELTWKSWEVYLIVFVSAAILRGILEEAFKNTVFVRSLKCIMVTLLIVNGTQVLGLIYSHSIFS